MISDRIYAYTRTSPSVFNIIYRTEILHTSFFRQRAAHLESPISQHYSIFVVAIQTEQSKSNSCLETFLIVKSIILVASAQPKLMFFIVLIHLDLFTAVHCSQTQHTQNPYKNALYHDL